LAFRRALDCSPPSIGPPASVKWCLGISLQMHAEVACLSAFVSALSHHSQVQSSGSGDIAKVVVNRPVEVRCELEVLSPVV